VGVHIPISPVWADFSMKMECTPGNVGVATQWAILWIFEIREKIINFTATLLLAFTKLENHIGAGTMDQ
jgi:hypothetical protein